MTYDKLSCQATYDYKLSCLCIKGVVMEEVSAVECFAMCLIQSDYVFPSIEDLNLKCKIYMTCK